MTNRNDEVRVERRDGVPGWVWVIGLVLLALLAWWLLTMNNTSGTPSSSQPPAVSPSMTTPSTAPSESTSPDASPS